ncbi:MAG: hypothetical protein J6Q51_04235, partial [Clostridia bacterium]|nr:hypothetical protein [Clostridia bacterium]
YFKTFNEIIEDLKTITPLKQDLSNEQDMNSVLVMIKRVMINIQKASRFGFTEQQIEVYSQALKELGCTNYKNSHESFRAEGSRSLSETMSLNKNIEFPLSALTQLIDTNSSTFEFGLAKMSEGDEYSWISTWLKAQGIEYKNFDEYVKGSNKYNQEGVKYIYPQMKDRWEYAVSMRMSDVYKGLDLNDALELMKMLDEGKPITEVMTAYNNLNTSGAAHTIIKSLVVDFSKRGPEFGRATELNITPEREEYYRAKEERNRLFELELRPQPKTDEYAG